MEMGENQNEKVPSFFSTALEQAKQKAQDREQKAKQANRKLLIIIVAIVVIGSIVGIAFLLLFMNKRSAIDNRRAAFYSFANYMLYAEDNSSILPQKGSEDKVNVLDGLFWDRSFDDSFAHLTKSKELLDKLAASYDGENLPEAISLMQDDVVFLITYSKNMPADKNEIKKAYREGGENGLAKKIGKLNSAFYDDGSKTSERYTGYYYAYLDDLRRVAIIESLKPNSANYTLNERVNIERFISGVKSEIYDKIYELDEQYANQ